MTQPVEIPLKPKYRLRGKWPKSQKSHSNNNRKTPKKAKVSRKDQWQGELRFLLLQASGKKRMITETELNHMRGEL